MWRILKKILLGFAMFMGLVIIASIGWVCFDMLRFRLAANPCERDCLEDSGGLIGCRQLCASHPTTYGPATK